MKPFGPLATPSPRVTDPLSDGDASKDRVPGEVDFDAVYQAHAQTVARWAARLGGPGVDVEDITQEVFVVADRRLREFRNESGLATWLFSITAKIVANDRRRRRLRHWWLRLTPNAGNDVAAGTDTPLEQLEKRERRRQFYEALDGVGERQRRVLVLFELEGCSIAEIAALTRLRPGNVRVLLHRARAAFLKRMTARELRETLARPEPDGDGE
ncbi:MAG TPA: sigma-70 family RNA polymerase sigma factor [Polyangia bacterium]